MVINFLQIFHFGIVTGISGLSLISFLMIMPGLLYASDAYIKTEKSIGQGFLFERQTTCYLATPEHVVEGASSISFMTADRKSHEAEIVKIFEVDLAILKVDDFKACLHKQPDTKTRLSSILKVYRDGVLKSRLSDGSILQTKVTIKGIDQEEYLQILPRKKSDILKQGFSGSILYIADQPAGMLLEVDDENVGYVYRQDAISEKLSSYFKQDTKKSIKFKQPQNSILQVGSIKGDIAKDNSKKYIFSWENNSPITLSLAKAKQDYSYMLSIMNAEGEVQYSKKHRSIKSHKFAFTPMVSGVYTIKLVGIKGHGRFNIKIDQLTLDSQLRGAGNVVEAGDSLTGTIALNSIAEYKYSGEENSPIILSLAKAKQDYSYMLSIMNAEGEVQYSKKHRSIKSHKFAFTPMVSGVYTIKLVGIKGHGKFNIKIDQLTLDSQLRGAGNVVEAGDSLTGTIALNSIAEYKYSGEENSPIILSLAKAKQDYSYMLSIMNAESEVQYSKKHRSIKSHKFAFTPMVSGVYTIKLVGIKGHGKFNIKIDQLTLDSQLRGAGNVVEAGDSLTGTIALNSIAEYKYSGEENSPIILSLAKAKQDYSYMLSIMNAEGEVQYSKKYRSIKSHKFAFTPMVSGVYTIKLVGIKGHGKFNIKIDQLTLDSQLRGAGNVVEAGDSLTGTIALNSIAEYKYSGEENSPIILSLAKAKQDYSYMLSIMNAEGEVQYSKKHRSIKSHKFAFTPMVSGVYTIKLVGTKGHGKFNIKVKK